MIFGGYRSYPIEPNSQAWWVDGKYWNLQRYPEELKRHKHTSIYLGFVVLLSRYFHSTEQMKIE